MKDSERLRRAEVLPILYSNITLDSKLPKVMEAFWPAPENKVKLEQLIKDYVVSRCTAENYSFEIVLSRIIGDEISSETISIVNSKIGCYSELNTDHEEADVRIIPHVDHAIRRNCERAVILSSDADVFAISLNFYYIFASNDLLELWIRGELEIKLATYLFTK